MKALSIALVLLLTSAASAQWGYVPIERSRSYWSVGRYTGPVYPSYGGYYDYGRIGMPVTVYVRQDPLDPYAPMYRRGW